MYSYTCSLHVCAVDFVIFVVNYIKFAVQTIMLSGQQPGNKNSRVPGSWPGTRVTGSDPGTRVPVPSTNAAMSNNVKENKRKAHVRHATKLSNFIAQYFCPANLPAWLGKLPNLVMTSCATNFYCAMLHRARLCLCKSSVCLSVTFKYVFHTGWSTSKIISRLISLRLLLGLTPTLGDLVQRERLQN